MPTFREAFAADFHRLREILCSVKSDRFDMDKEFRMFQLSYFKTWHPMDPFIKATMEAAESEYRARRMYS